MSRNQRLVLTLCGCFAAGIAAGIWLQHRWPVGRFQARWSLPAPVPAPLQPSDIAALPPARRLVIVAIGQSNAANYVSVRAAGGQGVYVFHDGRLLAAVDPLPGGDGSGGSIWTRLGAQLASGGQYDAVVIAVAAQGSSTVCDWAQGGRHHGRLASTLTSLAAASLSPDLILWQQGETEGRSASEGGARYLAALHAVQAECRALAPGATFIPALATRHGNDPLNEQIRIAQRAGGTGPYVVAGPDLDALGAEFRVDGVHFSQRGAAAAADLWRTAMEPVLAQRRQR